MELFFNPNIAAAVLLYAFAFLVVVFTITVSIRCLRGDFK